MAPKTTSTEIYIRHLTVDEALYRLEPFLDKAFRAAHVEVRIIHGKGAGVLRDAVHQLLSGHPLVKAYQTALPNDGDTGVTIANLDT
jgi:DNA mismatch repair protein MutS2